MPHLTDKNLVNIITVKTTSIDANVDNTLAGKQISKISLTFIL